MKKIVSFSFVFILCLNTLAQNVGVGTATPKARLHIADSNVVFTGPATLPAITNFNPPLQGAGTRMMWYPQKGAFRVGSIDGAQWNKDNIGSYSLAAGLNTTAGGQFSIATGDSTAALGYASTALGSHTIATGSYSTAMGFSTTASGYSSTATGVLTIASGTGSFASGFASNASGYASTALGSYTTASGDGSTAMGEYSVASRLYSTAIGTSATASGYYSTALGAFTTASGTTSISMGAFTVASGDRSTSMGSYTTAEGHSSTSMGSYTKAKSASSLVVGRFNDTTSLTSLFEIGNGGGDNSRSNAMTVLNNGSVRLSGYGDFSIDKYSYYGERMIVKENGNVGIGRQNPTSLLHIGNGPVRIEGPAIQNGSIALSMGGFGDILVDRPGTAGGRFAVKENGNVGIGKENPSLQLEVFSSPSGVSYHPMASVGIEKGISHYLNLISNNASETGVLFGNAMSSADGGIIYRPTTLANPRSLYFRVGDITKMMLYQNGNAWLAGNLSQASDARLKKNITPLSNTLSSLQQLNGYTYNWKDEKKDTAQQIGLIAQELQKVYPQLVKATSDGELSVNYIGLIPVLLESIKELKKEIEELKMKK